MTRHVKKYSHGDYWKLAVMTVAVFSAAYLVIGHGSVRTAESEPTAKFADASPAGLAIIPASGVSETFYYGQGTYYGYGQSTYYGYGQSTYYGYGQASYIPGYSESTYYGYGQSSYTPGQSSYTGGQSSYAPGQSSYSPSTCWDGSTPVGGSCPPCPTGYFDDGAGHCIPPSAPSFVGFTTTQGFTASGHLEVRPSLVRSGDKTRVYWNVSNVRDCTVTGTNGDRWTTLSSGASGQQTSAIGSRTDYTMFCHSLIGATPSTITETRTVNVIPRWFEPSGS